METAMRYTETIDGLIPHKEIECVCGVVLCMPVKRGSGYVYALPGGKDYVE